MEDFVSEKRIYGPKDIEGIDTGYPGQYPYRRGIHETMHTPEGRLWTMRQFAGFGDAQQTNARFLDLLSKGQTGLSTAFDMPTLLGLDSSNEESLSEVGMGGVAVDTIADMERLFQGIDLGEVSTSMTVNASAIALLAMYFELARDQGVSFDNINGTIQNDPLKEFIAQNEWIVPPQASVKLLVDTIEYCNLHVPRFNPVSISGYHIREAGADAAQELAFTLADGTAYVEACLERGMELDSFVPRFSFFFDFCNDFLEEIAKIRAAREMWAKIIKERFGSENERSQMLRVHIQTSGHTLTQKQPLNNIARVAIQALGAVLAGTQSLHTNSYDEQLSLPSEQAATTALRTQQIIGYESGVTNFVDALGGSYVIEDLTDKLTGEASHYIDRIDEMGGMIKAVEQGWPQSQIVETAFARQKAEESGEAVVVGQNMFNDEPSGTVEFKPDQDVSRRQIEFLETVKSYRSQSRVNRALQRLREDAKNDKNCMEAVCEAVSVLATVQEICEALRDVYGPYEEKLSI